MSTDEPIEMAIKRFRKQVERGGVISECRRRIRARQRREY